MLNDDEVDEEIGDEDDDVRMMMRMIVRIPTALMAMTTMTTECDQRIVRM